MKSEMNKAELLKVAVREALESMDFAVLRKSSFFGTNEGIKSMKAAA